MGMNANAAALLKLVTVAKGYLQLPHASTCLGLAMSRYLLTLLALVFSLGMLPAQAQDTLDEPESTDVVDSASDVPEMDGSVEAVEEASDAVVEALGDAVVDLQSAPDPEELLPQLKDFELPEGRPLNVWVVPVKTQIGDPSLFVLRRAAKLAIEDGADVMLLDMDTPGGRLDSCLEMMDILNKKFEGTTLTYVHDEAISAGAIIASITDHIYFAPHAQMGAAAAVSGGGGEIEDTMKAKINSYLEGRIRSFVKAPYRYEVIKAMMNMDYELKIDGKLLKAKGELLTLTADEARKLYGDPATPLLSAGTAEDIESIIEKSLGAVDYEINYYEPTWSEGLASFLIKIAGVLFGLGFIMVVIEAKTPSFGLLGGLGIAFILIALFGQHVAGLAGFEALIILAIGIVFLALEVFVIPGFGFAGILGLLMIMAGIVWSFVDIWPQSPDEVPADPGQVPEITRSIDWSSLVDGVENLGIAMVIAMVGILVIIKTLPDSILFKRFVHQGSTAKADPVVSAGGRRAGKDGGGRPEVGAVGKVIRTLHPVGEVEIDGKHYEATTSVGEIKAGEQVEVVGYRSFSLLVNRK